MDEPPPSGPTPPGAGSRGNTQVPRWGPVHKQNGAYDVFLRGSVRVPSRAAACFWMSHDGTIPQLVVSGTSYQMSSNLVRIWYGHTTHRRVLPVTHRPSATAASFSAPPITPCYHPGTTTHIQSHRPLPPPDVQSKPGICITALLWRQHPPRLPHATPRSILARSPRARSCPSSHAVAPQQRHWSAK